MKYRCFALMLVFCIFTSLFCAFAEDTAAYHKKRTCTPAAMKKSALVLGMSESAYYQAIVQLTDNLQPKLEAYSRLTQQDSDFEEQSLAIMQEIAKLFDEIAALPAPVVYTAIPVVAQSGSAEMQRMQEFLRTAFSSGLTAQTGRQALGQANKSFQRAMEHLARISELLAEKLPEK